MNSIRDVALWFCQNKFSIIPVKKDKKPFVSWEKFQLKRADMEQINGWWDKWPKANIGVVTGKISGIDVVDVDSKEGRTTLSEFLPDSFITPIATTPKGWHVWFKHEPGLTNGVRVIHDCDLRTTGGYVIAPPSITKYTKNNKLQGGVYEWVKNLTITEISPAMMPDMLKEILTTGQASAHPSAHKKDSILYIGDNISKGGTVNKRQHLTTNDNISFKSGSRDNTLFHLANYLVRGGMPAETIRKYLEFIALHCEPPYPEKDIQVKIESALKRAHNRDRNLTQEIREMIVTTSGNITTTYVYNQQQVTTREGKKKVAVILGRLAKEGLLEPTGRIAGEYRIIDNCCEAEDWKGANTDTVKMWLPFGLDEMIEISPGSIILFSGAQDAGKSAILMNIAQNNMHAWNVHYFSSELNAGSFKRRITKFKDITPDMWNVKFYQRSNNFADVIKTGAGNLNLIDYLEIHTEFYLVARYLAEIHDKLNGALAIVAIQKTPGAIYGRGGSFTEEKPILNITLDKGMATISKFKGEWQGENPNGKIFKYKIRNGCELYRANRGLGWHRAS